MNKTFSITDKIVLNHLEELKSNGIKVSQYITDLILKDINKKDEQQFDKNDFIKIIMYLLSLENKNISNESSMNRNINTLDETHNTISKISNILDID